MQRLLFWLSAAWCLFGYSNAMAELVEYQFSGLMSGFTQAQLGNLTFTPGIQFSDVPFQVAITGDLSNSAYGYGLGYDDGLSATWSLQGYDKSNSPLSQVFSASGHIAFSWDGKVFPYSATSGQPVLPGFTTFDFYGAPPNVPVYNQWFYSDIPPTAIQLSGSLANPPNVLPEYTTRILFPNLGSVTLTSMSNMTYSVSPIPEPSQLALLVSGLTILGFMSRRRKSI